MLITKYFNLLMESCIARLHGYVFLKKKAKILCFLICIVVFFSCNYAYKAATGMRNPRLEDSISIKTFADNNGLSNGCHYLISEELFFDPFIGTGSLDYGQIWLYDEHGHFSCVLPNSVTPELLEKLSKGNDPLLQSKRREFILLKSRIDSTHFDRMVKLNVDTIINKLIKIGNDNYVRANNDYMVVIPWAIYMGKKDQLKFIRSIIKAINKNRSATFQILFVNYDVRSDFKKGKALIDNFELKLKR